MSLIVDQSSSMAGGSEDKKADPTSQVASLIQAMTTMAEQQQLLLDAMSKSSQSERDKRAEEREAQKEFLETQTKKLEKEAQIAEKKREQELAKLELDVTNKLIAQGGDGRVNLTMMQPSSGKRLPQLKPPEPLSGSANLVEFNSWHVSWSDYAGLIGLESYKQSEQLALLRNSLSKEMLYTLRYALGVDEDTTLSVAEVIAKLKDKVKKSRNIYLHRFDFTSRRQQDGESFDNFLADLKILAENGDPCYQCSDQRPITQIIVGLRDHSVRLILLGSTEELTLDAVLKICRSREAAQQAEASLSSKTHVNKASGYHRDSGGNAQNVCQRCGATHKRGKCKAKKYKCHECNERGHFSMMCPQRRAKKGQAGDDSDSD